MFKYTKKDDENLETHLEILNSNLDLEQKDFPFGTHSIEANDDSIFILTNNNELFIFDYQFINSVKINLENYFPQIDYHKVTYRFNRFYLFGPNNNLDIFNDKNGVLLNSIKVVAEQIFFGNDGNFYIFLESSAKLFINDSDGIFKREYVIKFMDFEFEIVSNRFDFCIDKTGKKNFLYILGCRFFLKEKFF